MKKRILLTFMLMNIIILALGGISVSAYDGTKYGDYLYYEIEKTGEVTITDCVASATVIEIPAEIEDKKVTSIGRYAFDSCVNLTSVTIPDGVITIGYHAFYQCNNLTSVTIPDSVISIEDSAFYKCNNLTGITIPDSVTEIGNYAFYQCNSLTSITIPRSVTELGSSAFYNCKSLTSISISDGVPAICDRVFYGCSSLTSVTIPNSVTSIGEYAFYDCSSLTSVTMPNSLTFIGDSAFFYCSNLTSIIIPDGVISIGRNAFTGCSNLTSITIPDSITWIGGYAFSQCNSLKRVNITDIDKWCEIGFGDSGANPLCYGGKLYINNKVVTDAVITNKATKIGDYTFCNCSSLTSIIIPNGVTSIGDYAFSSCSNLTSIIIPNGVISIGSSAFYRCSSLTSVTISDSVTTIGDDAFNSCYGLKRVNITDIDKWCEIEFGSYDANPLCYARVLCINNKVVTNAVITNKTTKIGDYAFYLCSSLTSITIPDSVTSIGDSAFCYCSGLTSITIPDSVTTIGDDAFQYCSSLTSITIPDSVTTIGNDAFQYCSSLTSVTIPDSITRIGTSAFYGCGIKAVYISDLEAYLNCCYLNDSSNPNSGYATLYLNGKPLKGNLEIPSGVTRIPSYAFFNCTDLTSVTFPDSVMTIGRNAFNGCSGLTSVTIPDSVTIIEDYAFYHCSNISAVFYAGTEEEWNEVYLSSDNDTLNDATKVYNATKKTYKFETNCVNKLADVTDYYIAKMPVIENCDKTLLGWYDNKELSGAPIVFPYYGTATTLYAAWTDKTGLSFDDAFTAKANMQYNVTTTEEGQLIYYKFVPRLTGEYRFYSTGNLDTCGYLYDSRKCLLISNDDDGDGRNFIITYTLTAGETYYIAAKVYSGTGSFTLVTKSGGVESTNTIWITSTTGEKIFITFPNYLPENVSIILACYKNNALTEVMTAPNKNETLYFIAKKDFDFAKVMVWDNLESMTPICEAEIVK